MTRGHFDFKIKLKWAGHRLTGISYRSKTPARFFMRTVTQAANGNRHTGSSEHHVGFLGA